MTYNPLYFVHTDIYTNIIHSMILMKINERKLTLHTFYDINENKWKETNITHSMILMKINERKLTLHILWY